MSMKFRKNQNYGPCQGCSYPTPSPSGYCEACRKVNCACGRIFIARKFGVKKCPKCPALKSVELKRIEAGAVV